MKNIIFCCDGTWNEPNPNKNNYQGDTNVRLFYESLAGRTDQTDSFTQQIAAYDTGIGADETGIFSEIKHYLAGCTGIGLVKKILDAYLFICQHYQPGDKIYLFGFSRGAYTVRSVCAMLSLVGLLPHQAGENDISRRDKAKHIFYYYKFLGKKPIETFIDKLLLSNKIKSYQLTACPAIQMLGVWDTVGALGIPSRIFSIISRELFEFVSTQLDPKVKYACQALAIDEHRDAFSPTVWEDRKGVEQVWFAGDHADIGGSWPETDLADISLMWMYQKARAQGVIFKTQPHLASALNPAGMLHNNFSHLYQYITRTIPNDASVHQSVQQRLLKVKDYNPQNLIYSQNRVLAPSYHLTSVS